MPAIEVSVDQRPIGVFDSGVGGISVAHEIRRILPGEDLVYFADQVNCPYGPRSTEEIRALATAATRRILEYDVKLVVVACNTASTVALAHLREQFRIPFVGIVPAIKPACATTRSGTIAVLATQATLTSAAFEDLIERHGRGANVIRVPCPDFVELVEADRADQEQTERVVFSRVAPLPKLGVDHLVLGCTHFEFLRPMIRRSAGPQVAIVGAAKPVAEQVARVLTREALLARRAGGNTRLQTSGDPQTFEVVAKRLLGDYA